MANVWYLSNKLFLGKLGREKKTVHAHQTRPRYEVVQQTLHPHILRLGTGSFCLLPILSIIFPIIFPIYFPYISHIETTILHRISRRFPWICLWRAEAKVGIALMQHEATEVATDAELLDPRDSAEKIWRSQIGQKGRHGPMIQWKLWRHIYIYTTWNKQMTNI